MENTLLDHHFWACRNDRIELNSDFQSQKLRDITALLPKTLSPNNLQDRFYNILAGMREEGWERLDLVGNKYLKEEDWPPNPHSLTFANAQKA